MKIGLCGTMSVGKTTLVNALKETKQFKDYMFRTERSKFLMEKNSYENTIIFFIFLLMAFLLKIMG
jgi:GTPase SAR1 family protein